MIVYNDFNKGRLGNQLFFVASTMGISIKNNVNYGFTTQMSHSGLDYQSIFLKKLPITNSIPHNKYQQNGFCYEDIIITDAELIGYYQSEKFFEHCKILIKEQFEFKPNIVSEILHQYPDIKDSLSIHIRRGDYINQPNHHPTIALSYYEKILSFNKQNYNKIFVFSDDSEWAKQNFAGNEYILPHFNHNNDLYSFILMSLSKDNVISNSTYSWWAAWLNKNENKKVFSPHHKQWFGTSYSNLDTKDLIPNEWTQIEY
jgi:hypothetical protein